MNILNWAEIDTVLLDMDGTLLDLHFDNFFWLQHLPTRFAELNSISLEEANAFLQPIFLRERGKLTWYCIDYWEEQTELNLLALKQEVSHLIQIRPYVTEFLKALRQANKTALLVTNAHPKSIRLKMEKTKLNLHLDGIHSSHDFFAPKESPDFWPRLHEQLNFDPKRTLFIDDTTNVLHSAKEFGIQFLLGLKQPDSQRPAVPLNAYPSILHFDEILGEI